jgi:hypothetical protein
MEALRLDTVLCVVQGVPCVVALAKGKDPTTRTVCGIVLALAVVLGFSHYVGIVLRDPAHWIVAVALGALGIFAAVRVAQPVLSTLIVYSGLLLALLALGVVS